ncbi:MAG: 16S rRNA (uracil(1498)-N(3))-methyltransferase [Armatimonadetes bacterium]|nr:16S rRNA (uracil(1498)-N(3))-methyltransferase [Armatimonadota bacterium]
MDRSHSSSLRALPRAFVPGVDAGATIELPEEEVKKFRNVLRLSSGAEVAILPNDGSLIRCTLAGKQAEPIEVVYPETESSRRVTLALGLPKPESLETAIRMGTEMGIAEFLVFPAARTVVKWTAEKWEKRLVRLNAIAREAAEVSFRTNLPKITILTGLEQVFSNKPDAFVLSEVEGVDCAWPEIGDESTIVIGPEGGWAPQEVKLIGDRAISLGKRVMRVDTAVAAACSLLLSGT